MSGVAAVRRGRATDRPALRHLVEQEVGGSPYAEVPRYYLSLALDHDGDESRALVAERGDELVGLVLYGEVAGAIGAGRLHLVAVTASARLRGVGARLCDAAVADLRSRGVRLVIAEMPDDPGVATGRGLLERSGFAEEARVADYYRDGVAMIIMRRDGRDAG